MKAALIACLALCAWSPRAAPPQEATPKPKQAATLEGAQAELQRALAEHKIHLDGALGLCAIPATVLLREDLLEYVLVNRSGNAHESLFVTEVQGSQLNVALLALGVQPGRNAVWHAREPEPTREEILAGVPAYTIEVPQGDGFHLYAGWTQGGETFFFRLEDLLKNLEAGRSLRRHAWVYLGSRSVPSRKDPAQSLFLADIEGNLINLCFFEAGSTLLTAALPECNKQTIWLPNAALLPPSGEPVLFVFSRQRLDCCPEALRARLPRIADEDPSPDGR